MNRNLYQLVLNLFESLKGRRCAHRDILDGLIEDLQIPLDSPVRRIARTTEPTQEQIKLVAVTLAKRAVDLHMERW
ncbi:MAG: hypothetical protein KDA77_00005 [Planctomycetaceae bacterium]|nr:hypothetical protein [Planctomycetaceae bacterium]